MTRTFDSRVAIIFTNENNERKKMTYFWHETYAALYRYLGLIRAFQ